MSLASGTTPISKERDKARARAHREQRKSRLSRSSNRKRIKLHTGDLVLSKVFAINWKDEKHLTPKFKGPLIVIRILTNGGILCVSPKTKKEIVINKSQLKKFHGKQPTNYLNLPHCAC